MAYAQSIDDADPRITYSTNWDFITSDHFTMPQWSGTAHSTSTIGTTARLRFTGSAIAVICIIPTSGGGNGVSRASFSIDNGPAKEVHIPTTLPVQFEVEFWNSGPLPFGPHSLVITNIGNDAYFRFDRVDYDPTDSHAPQSPASSLPPRTLTVTQTQGKPSPSDTTSSPSTTPSSSQRTSQSSGGSTGSINASITVRPVSSDLLSQSTTASPSSSSTGSNITQVPLIVGGGNSGSATTTTSSESQAPIAAIVGGTLGGLLILLLAVFLVFVRRRRAGQTPQRPSDGPDAATPFSMESSHQASSGNPMFDNVAVYPSHNFLASKSPNLGLASNHTVLQQRMSPQLGTESDIYTSSSSHPTEHFSNSKEDSTTVSTNRGDGTVADPPPPAYYVQQQASV